MTTDASIARYLEAIQIPLRLSCITPRGWPVVLSLWYLFDDGHLFCATPRKARVVSYLSQEPRCAFEIAGDQPPYCGVRGRARATIDSERGVEILERLLVRYVGDLDNPLARRLLGRPEPEVAIRLEPLSFHSWNFTARMQDSVTVATAKPCPD